MADHIPGSPCVIDFTADIICGSTSKRAFSVPFEECDSAPRKKQRVGLLASAIKSAHRNIRHAKPTVNVRFHSLCAVREFEDGDMAGNEEVKYAASNPPREESDCVGCISPDGLRRSWTEMVEQTKQEDGPASHMLLAWICIQAYYADPSCQIFAHRFLSLMTSASPSQLIAAHAIIVGYFEKIMTRGRAGICCGPVVLQKGDAANLGEIAKVLAQAAMQALCKMVSCGPGL